MAWSCLHATGYFVAFLGDISILESGCNMKKPLCCPALELFYCLPLWKTMVFVSFRAFSLSIPHFFVVYPFGKQWGYMEKSYKMQQKFLHTRCSNNYKSSQRLRKLSTSCEILNINYVYINQYKLSILNLQRSPILKPVSWQGLILTIFTSRWL